MSNQSTQTRIYHQIPDAVYQQLDQLRKVTIFHTKPWHSFLAKTFGWKVNAYITSSASGDLQFFLPFIEKRRFTKRVRISLPLSHRIGPAYGDDVDPADFLPDDSTLVHEIHEDLPVKYSLQVDDYYLNTLDLTKYKSPDEILLDFSESSIRRKIRKAQGSDLEIKKSLESDLIDDFTHLQAATRWRQGSPTYPRHFFHRLVEAFGDLDQMMLYIAYLDGTPVSGVLFLYYHDWAFYGYGASVNDRSIWKLGVNQLAMWEAIKDAFQRNSSEVDFGRTSKADMNLLEYKNKWGTETRPLSYTYLNMDNEGTAMRRDSTLVRAASQSLSKMPFPIFKMISPFIMKQVA